MSRRSRRTVLALIAVCCLGQPFTHAIKAQVTFATAADLTAIGGSQPLGGLVRVPTALCMARPPGEVPRAAESSIGSRQTAS